MTKPLTIFLLVVLLATAVNSQFAEIASVVGGLLPAVLGPTAGAAGAASAAGAGAAGALGSVGTLYQLAQSALALTGTGVGIINQASESSWFPAAVEQAVKMNRDFQERLLAGGAGAGAGGKPAGGGLGSGLFPLPGLPGAGKGTDKLGPEYGKNFETESEETGDGDGDGDESSREELITNKTPAPDLEKELAELEKQEKPVNITGKATIEEVTFPKVVEGSSETETNEETDDFGRPIQKPPAPLALSANRPKITVEIPAKFKKPDVKDYEELLGKPWMETKSETSFNTDSEEIVGIPEMVPELKTLINDLKGSNLTKAEIKDFIKQLEINKNIGEPRENTTPESPPDSSELGSAEQEPPPLPPPQPKKFGKNTEQLKRILSTAQNHEIVDSPTTPPTKKIILKLQTPPGFIPSFSTTVQPRAKAIVHPRKILSGTSHPKNIPKNNEVFFPRLVVEKTHFQPPKAQAAGVAQQIFKERIPSVPQQIYNRPQSQNVQPQPQIPQQNYQQPQQNYQNNAPQNYDQYSQQYNNYLRTYYPNFAQFHQPQNNLQQYYQPTIAPQRQYPVRTVAPVNPTTPPSWLAHPYGQGVLLTNQQPQYSGKK